MVFLHSFLVALNSIHSVWKRGVISGLLQAQGESCEQFLKLEHVLLHSFQHQDAVQIP